MAPKRTAVILFVTEDMEYCYFGVTNPRWHGPRDIEIECIGGTIEAGESALEAATREVWEEIGVDLRGRGWYCHPMRFTSASPREVSTLRVFVLSAGNLQQIKAAARRVYARRRAPEGMYPIESIVRARTAALAAHVRARFGRDATHPNLCTRDIAGFFMRTLPIRHSNRPLLCMFVDWWDPPSAAGSFG